MTPTKKLKAEIELEPDAWPRFERFIRDVAKAGPQHRKRTKPKDKSSKKSCEEKDDRGKMLRLEILWHQPCAKMRVHTNADSLNLLGR